MRVSFGARFNARKDILDEVARRFALQDDSKMDE